MTDFPADPKDLLTSGPPCEGRQLHDLFQFDSSGKSSRQNARQGTLIRVSSLLLSLLGPHTPVSNLTEKFSQKVWDV